MRERKMNLLVFFVGACCAKERRAPHSRCRCEHQTPGCYENPREKQEVVEWDCRRNPEPEFLEDHVRVYHPRLAPKLQVLPRCCTGKTNLRTGSREARSLGSRGAFGVGLQAAPRGSRAWKRGSRAASPAQRLKPLPTLPASHRYGYYRYYGAAGQGAKTSVDYSRRP